jgi:phosphatidylserine/phosphatidylglycerophosphate/cardiolipin synthase-like enzyme
VRLATVLKGLAGVVGAALAILVLALVADRIVLERPAETGSPTETASVGDGRRDLFVLPDDGAAVVLDEFTAAQRTIDIAVYLLTADEVVETLAAAVERGVRVRVLLEPDPFGGSGDVDADVAHLRALGIEVRFSGKDVRFGHIKTFVVDDRVALVTSLNLTNAALTDNRELGVVSTEPAVVSTARDLFEADWTGSEAPAPGPLVVSPMNSRATVEGLIAAAASTIDVYAEVIRDDAVVGLLTDRASRGVVVRVIVPDEVSPDDAGIYARLTRAGVMVSTNRSPYQHAKMLLIDGERALVGSINFTQTSMDDNREAGIVLDDALSTGRLAAVFAQDWSAAEPVLAGTAAAQRGVTRGNRTVTLLPRPTSLAMPIVPPWASTIILAIASPSPEPPRFRARRSPAW